MFISTHLSDVMFDCENISVIGLNDVRSESSMTPQLIPIDDGYSLLLMNENNTRPARLLQLVNSN